LAKETVHLAVNNSPSETQLMFSTDLYYFYLDTVPPIQIVFYHVAADELTSPNGGKFHWKSLMYYVLSKLSRIIVKTNYINRETFNIKLFNIKFIKFKFNIKLKCLILSKLFRTIYFTSELLPDNLSSEVALHFNIC